MPSQWVMPGPSGPVVVRRGGLQGDPSISRSRLERWILDPSCWERLCEMYEAAGGGMYRPINKRVSHRETHKYFLLFHLRLAFDRGDLTIEPGPKSFKGFRRGAPTFRPTPATSILSAVASSRPSNVVQPSSFGVTSLTLPRQIAPGAETISVSYTLRDPFNRIQDAVLEVRRKGGAASIWERKLSPEERTDGSHQLDWSGRIDAARDFPHGYLTLAASPYEVILRVSGQGTARPERQQAILEVKFSRITVALGPRSTLKEPRDQAVYDQMKALPVAKLSLFLKSNLFAVKRAGATDDEKYKELYDDTGYTAYQNLWGEGPRIPIVATVLLKDSQGKEVRAGKALGGSRILWDYIDPQATRAYCSSYAAAYIKKAVDHECHCSYPKGGGNAHCDFGGKRMSRAGTAAVFTAEDGKTDPGFSCTIKEGKARWWSVFSPIEKEGEGHSQANVLFCPSRIAGDRYQVSAYLEIREGELDCEELPKGAPQARVGEFEIRREITLARHLRKNASVKQSIPAVDAFFVDAFMKIDNRMGTGVTLTKEEYDAAFNQAVPVANLINDKEVKALVKRYALFPGSQYDNGGKRKQRLSPWIATVRDHSQFKAAVQQGEGWNGHKLMYELGKDGLISDTEYYKMVNRYMYAIAKSMGSYFAQEEGITILQFEWVHSLEETLFTNKISGRLLGIATLNTRNKSGFVCFEADPVTLAHELGHCLFLSHASSPPLQPQAGGVVEHLHDGKDFHCLMSYGYHTPGFCGLCLLRLRGWNQKRLNRHGPV